MTMTPEHQHKMLMATRDAAIALLEDIAHMRQFVTKAEPSPAELRRLSAIVRRLAVERDLSTVAAPRIGKILLNAPDNKPIYKAEGNDSYMFFASGGVQAFGATFRGIQVVSGTTGRQYTDFDPDRIISLPLDSFCSQRVLCLNGKWASRNDAIKYVANVASGVHSKTPTKDDEKLLARIRCVASYATGSQNVISIDFDAINTESVTFSYSATKLDPVLLELLAAIHFIITSPSVYALEAYIDAEVRGS